MLVIGLGFVGLMVVLIVGWVGVCVIFVEEDIMFGGCFLVEIMFIVDYFGSDWVDVI